MRSIVVMIYIAVLSFTSASLANPLVYTEPPDLFGEIVAPTNLGMLDAGINTVTGTLNGTFDTSCWGSGDAADAFSVTVPPGLTLMNISLEVTNMSGPEDWAGHVRTLIGGISSPVFYDNANFSNLLTGSHLGPGDYRLQLFLQPLENQFGGCDVGAISFSYQFIFTVTVTPTLLSVTDVGNDQGRRVRLSWLASGFDYPASPTPIQSYSVLRRIDSAKAINWDFVLNLPASGESGYSAIAETLCDSTAAGICWSTFIVRAHTAVPTTFFDSAPTSGYSVDNLVPGAPQALVVLHEPALVSLDWNDALDTDFAYFRIYRSTSSGFVPNPSNMVFQTGASSWTDVTADNYDYQYLVTAVDFSGNESAASEAATVSSIPGAGLVSRFALNNAAPNPFNPSTTLAFELPRKAQVSLSVYDLTGRLVKTLVNETRESGQHSVIWNGRDSAGGAVASGIYLYRMEAEGYAETKRMTLVK